MTIPPSTTLRIQLCILAVFAAASLAHAETYRISPEGKDSAAGTSAEAAWRTLFKINAVAKPGDTFIIGAGTFELGKAFPKLTCAGTAEAPIRIKAADGARPRLHFEGWDGIQIAPGAILAALSIQSPVYGEVIRNRRNRFGSVPGAVSVMVMVWPTVPGLVARVFHAEKSAVPSTM